MRCRAVPPGPPGGTVRVQVAARRPRARLAVTTESIQPAEEPRRRGDATNRVLLAILGLVTVLATAVLLSAFLPRWWAHRVGAQVDGSITRGIVFGLFYGFVFVLLPLGVLRWTFRKKRSWRLVGWASLVALLLASPNLTTLGIVLGSGNAAHAGERTLDVEAPGFRYATLAGAIAAGAVWLWFEWLNIQRWRERRHAGRLGRELHERDRAAELPEPVDSVPEEESSAPPPA